MDYFLTERQKAIRELARKIAVEKVRPVRAQLDETSEFPREILSELAKVGLCGIFIPEQYGGTGDGCLGLCLAVEEIARVCAGVCTTFAATALGSMPILVAGSGEQKQKYLPAIASGKALAAFGLTEANAGSDAGAIETTAVSDGDYYVLNGRKQWITNAGEAQIYIIFAMTDKSRGSRGASAIIVEGNTPGMTFGRTENKMGIRASLQREIFFEDCRVPKSNVLGREGMGFIVAMKTLDTTRPGIGALSVGLAQGAYDEAIQHARTRQQFGTSIASFQAIQHMLADMATQIEAARALVFATARMIDAGISGVSKESAMAKVFASDMAMRVTTDAVQILGGYGYMKEYPVEKMMRDAKITQIYEGTNQIQRNIIARHLIKESAGGAQE
ncbi:MAG: acyl-CoA dehydrogenase [Candidatus Abyssobacteria bacterium SURF_17]|jgi:butyryl-CoA dehydrogenase|uniref:Cyclohex-1-ene-1-carbonyl-CoA dehydrogenase n=1 Tax=Candidatus Abyssobacteria bacterium SURF_17 TaxID=2093361 RepID=A0A419ET46_9BACT|nr:MAG: acyl-CoA dehydrogenase [Candidatus Abyssubacteria bacterium SURF_17]